MPDSPSICHVCGSPLPEKSGSGRCPACLISAAFDEGGEGVLGEMGGHDLLEEIARGGMGVIYRARQREPEREVALKAILGGWLSAPEVRERFRLEARAMASLEHPAILPVHQFGEEDGVPFFTMKLAEGGSLTSRMASYAGRWREMAEMMTVVAEAVQFAHDRGVLHRDLKPGNILFDGTGLAFVSDFGMAKLMAEDSDLTRSAAFLGTPHYLAPEIAGKRRSRGDCGQRFMESWGNVVRTAGAVAAVQRGFGAGAAAGD
jgi:serine/threonine protein kinase